MFGAWTGGEVIGGLPGRPTLDVGDCARGITRPWAFSPIYSRGLTAMSGSTPNKDGQSGASFWYQLSTDSSSQSPSVPPAVSAPSLALWSRKLALQSEELAGLIQASSTKLSSHQEHLQDLLGSCKADVAAAKKELEATSKRRDNESTYVCVCVWSTILQLSLHTRSRQPPDHHPPALADNLRRHRRAGSEALGPRHAAHAT